MNSQFLLKPIPMDRILEIANCHFKDAIPVIDKNANNSVTLIARAGTKTEFIMESIGNWDFLCTHVIGTYTTTMAGDADAITDDGVCRLLFNFTWGGWNRQYGRKDMPLDQYFTPGRVRHPNAVNNTGANQCPQGNSLLIPKPLPVLLLKAQSLTLTITNTGALDQLVTCTLEGWRVTVKEAALNKVLASIENKG